MATPFEIKASSLARREIMIEGRPPSRGLWPDLVAGKSRWAPAFASAHDPSPGGHLGGGIGAGRGAIFPPSGAVCLIRASSENDGSSRSGTGCARPPTCSTTCRRVRRKRAKAGLHSIWEALSRLRRLSQLPT